MRKLAIFFAIVCFVTAAPKWHQLEGYTFDQYISDFAKKYEKGTLEFDLRKAIFESKLNHVKEFNNGPHAYKKGINIHSDKTVEELAASSFGLAKNMKPTNVFRKLIQKTNEISAEELAKLPDKVDWRDQDAVSPVKDQGHCGSCWAFASTAVLESHAAIASGHLKTLSTQQLVSCMVNPYQCGGQGGCNGATAELAFAYVQTFGQTSEWKYSYASYQGDSGVCSFNPKAQTIEITIDGYVKLPENSYSHLLHAVATQGPVAISVDASSWHDYEVGVFTGCDANENVDINHAVVLVGYGTDEKLGDYWLVRNSWGTRWGENGYIRIKREPESTCKIDKTPMDGTACIGYDTPVSACGQCGILYDSAYPLGVKVVG